MKLILKKGDKLILNKLKLRIYNISYIGGINMKKKFALILIVSVLLSFFGCEKKIKEEKVLKMGFVPLMDQEKLIDSVEPLSDVLSKAIGIKVEAFTASNYVGVVEAMGSSKVDFGIIPPFAYVLAHKTNGAKVILSALNKDGKSFYRSEFIVMKNSGIKSLKDLKGKKVAFVDPSSSSGYIYPGAKLKKEGFDLDKDIEAVYSGGHDKSLQLLVNGDVDCACVYEGAEKKFEKDFPKLKDAEVLEYTDEIPYIAVAVNKDLDDETVEKIKEGIMKSLNEGEGKELIIKLFNLYGFKEASDKDYESIIDTAEIMNIDLKKE